MTAGVRRAASWAVVALGLTAIQAALAASPGEPLAFEAELPAAIATAAARRQAVFVHFSAPWCEPCQRMKRDLYPRPEVAARLARFVRVEVDTDTPAGAQAWMDYRLPGLPVVAFLRPDGTELPDQRLTGVPSEARLLAAMDAALSLSAPAAPPAAASPAPRPGPPSAAPAAAPPGDGLLVWLMGLLGLAGLLGAGLLALRWRRGSRPRAVRGRRASSGSPPPSM